MNTTTRILSVLGAAMCLFLMSMHSAQAQLTASEAGYINAVTDYGAKNDGLTVTTTQLQNAIDAAIAQGKGLFLPAGQYLIDRQLEIMIPLQTSDDLQRFVMQGSSVSATNRSVIVLKAGTFPSESTKGVMLHNAYYDGNATTRTYNRVIQSIDFKMQSNNAGAIALSWRGAEGCGVFDVHIDATGGYAGIQELPGSGGSIANISVIGGKYGIDLWGGVAQPTPTITDIKMSGQTQACFYNSSIRGAFVVTGGEFTMNPGVPVYKGQRHTTFTYHYGGCPVFTDCKIEYTSYNASNLVFQFTSTGWDISFNLTDVYVKNADRIVAHDATVSSNTSGWRLFKHLAYNSGTRTFNAGTFDDGIYLNGAKSSAKFYEVSEDVTSVPSDLTSAHSWGNTFPSFETPGAVNVNDYSGSVVDGDWGPAFNAAIAAAEANGSNVVFVPTGQYSLYSTISLRRHTKLIGVSHHHSEIFGYDIAGRRFGGSTDAFADPRPMVQSFDADNADNIVADLAIRPAGPYNNSNHNPEPCVHYALLWQAGMNSVVRNISCNTKVTANYRAGLVYGVLDDSKWLNLRVVDSLTTVDGFNFSSSCASRFFNFVTVPSNIFLETVNSSKRLLSRSYSPFNTAPVAIKKSNITITKNGGGSFTLNSLKVANGSWNPKGGSDIKLEGYNGTAKVKETTIPMTGLNKPRTNMELLSLNWTGITKVVITSDNMFSIDDVTVNSAVITFESLTGVNPTEGVAYESALYYDTGRDLPLSMINHHLIKITGGVKWYNHTKHGDTWMRPTQAYMCIENNSAPVNIYHFHAQHSQNDQKMLMSNASGVSVFGIKTENAGYFIRALNCDNIRIFGHGGMTNPPPGSAHYYFENTTNYMVSAPTDEIYSFDDCVYCGSGNALLPKVKAGTYDAIVEVEGTTRTAPSRYDRPIIWVNGSPWAAYRIKPAPFTTLDVTADTYVTYNTDASKNFGGGTFMRNRNSGATSLYTHEMYLKFDLSSVSGTVQNATLRLYLTRVDGANLKTAYLVNDDSWQEMTITANNQPTSLGGVLATWTPAAVGFIDVPVDMALLQGEIDGDKTLSIKVKASNNKITLYRSKEGNLAQCARLIINDPAKNGKIEVKSAFEKPIVNQMLNIYPNPVSDVLNVVWGTDVADISIYSLDGRKVYSARETGGYTQVPVQESLQKGVYIMKVHDGNQLHMSRFIVR